jgi:dihydrofolate reductase
MKIKYKIKEIKPKVFAVIVPDRYHRAMLFMRVQEFYESPNPKFRGKSFGIWDYIEWYSRKHSDNFSYAADWVGFNFPLKVAQKCYNHKAYMYYSPYDVTMCKILDQIKETVNLKYGPKSKAYIIGVSDTVSSTFQHELCHAYYHIDNKYKKEADAITKEIDPKTYNRMCKNLTDMGYTEQVFNDEIQAYTCMDSDYFEFNNKIPGGKLNKLSKKYKLIYEKYINQK